MDELTLIRNFAASEPAASPVEWERVRAALVDHIAHASQPRRTRRPWFIGIAIAVFLLLAGTALALGPLHGLFEGQPAPPRVKHAIAGYNDFHEQLVRQGLGGFVVRAEDATGLIRFRAAETPVRVWTAPLVDGGSCTFVETPSSRNGLMIGPCIGAVNVQPPVLYGLARNRELGLLAGHVTDAVARLQLRLASGRTRNLPLVQGFFATGVAQPSDFAALELRESDALVAHQKREARHSSLPPKKLAAHQAAEWKALARRRAARRAAARPTELAAYDATGRRIANVKLASAIPDTITFPLAPFYTGMHALLQINTSLGTPATLMLHEHGDKNCEVVSFAGAATADPATGDSRCGQGVLRGSSFPGRSLVIGDAGEDAATAEVRYASGERQALLLLEGRFLVELTDEQLNQSPELVVRDASGQVIRTRKLVRPTPGP